MENEKNILKLRKNVFIDGEELSQLEYDFDTMTAKDKMDVSKEMISCGCPPSSAEELDTNYHLFLFAKAAEKANSKVNCTDILRLSAKDAQAAGALARDFFYLS